MSNYSFSSTLDGLNTIDADDVNSDNIVTDYLTVNINSSVPLVTPYTTNSNQIASCAFVQNAFASNLSNYVTLNTTQTITGNKTFNGTITKNATTNDYSDYRFVSVQGGGEATQIYQVAGGMTITSISNNKFISINTKDISGNALNGLVCRNGNQVTIQGKINEGIEILNDQITMNGNLALNKPFVSNYVDLTLTTYENQFYGDIYGYRGVVCEDGFYVKSSPGAGATTYALIDASGNISTTSNVSAQSITLPNGAINDSYLTSNVPLKNGTNLMSGTTNFLTGTNTCQTRPTGTDDTTLANTAFVKNNLASYVKLNNISSNQTLTGTGRTIFNTGTTFNDTMILNSSIDVHSTLTFYDGTHATQFNQTANNLTVYTTAAAGIKMGTNFTDNIVCSTNRAYLQGSSGNTIDINGTQATIGGTSVPRITTEPLAASNTNEIATTQWTKTQLSGYPTLNLNNTFNGSNNFNKSVEFKDVSPIAPVVVRNTVSSNSGGLLISGVGSYNGINNAGDFVVLGLGPSIDTGILNLTTWATGTSGIKITNNAVKQYCPFECAYLQTSPPITAKTNYNIGYQFIIPGSSFTGQNWTTFSTSAYIIQQIAWNGSGDYTLGVWHVEINIVTNCNASPLSHLTWGTSSNTNIRKNATYQGVNGSFGGNGQHIMNLQFILPITNLTTTYYVNHWFINGTSLSPNLTNSQIVFTRIA